MARTLSRYESLVRRLFGVKGEVVVPGLSSELLLSAVVEPGNETHHYLRKERPIAFSHYQPAVAGQYSEIRITQTQDTHLTVVRKISVQGSAQQRYGLAISNPYSALVVANLTILSRDTRAMTIAAPYLHPCSTKGSSGSTGGPVTGNLWKFGPSAANVADEWSGAIVLSKDWQLALGAQTANTAMTVSMEILEVPIVPQEE